MFDFIGKDFLTSVVIAAFIAAFFSLIVAAIAASTTNKSIYVNAIIAEQIKWIANSRDIISDYIKIAAELATKEPPPSNLNYLHDEKYKKYTELFTSIVITESKITLMLNPNNSFNCNSNLENNLFAYIQALRQSALSGGIIIHNNKILRHAAISYSFNYHAQFFLNLAWNQLKIEASHGKKRRYYKSIQKTTNLNYSKFLNDDIILREIIDILKKSKPVELSQVKSTSQN